MIVYRFERNGIGPYMSRSNAYRITKDRMKYRTVKKYTVLLREQQSKVTKEHYANYHIAHRHRKYIYGCSSKEQLKRYFYGDFKILFSQGFRVKRYKVPDDQILDLGNEVAFPVKYHKFQSVKKVEKQLGLA